jgi:acyl-CoA reductase-like NAD-dependent aldehyde dehydrogenase
LEAYQQVCQSISGKIIINSEWIDAYLKTNKKIPVINPATLSEIGFIAECDDTEIDVAVIAAEKAYSMWKKTSAQKRGCLVQEAGQVLKRHADLLAKMMSHETGKAIKTESRVELTVIHDTFQFYGGLALELKGDTIPFDPKMLTLTLREPLGVVGAIIPWNVPLMLMAMKIAPALVAGNTVVLKPSPEASFCVLKAVELMNTVLPPGVLNVITGGPEAGKKLGMHPKIKKVAFTGSVESGRQVYKSAAEKLIPVTLELGGKSPFIIFGDVDIDKVVESAYEGMRFSRQGQSCSATSRLFVHESIHDIFVEKLLALLDKKVIGDPMSEATDIGTLISKKQYDKVQAFIELAQADNSLKIHQASQVPTEPHLKSGLFLRPTLITGVKNDHKICQEEIFGPVAAVLKWSNIEQAIREANEVEFGLAAGVWTQNLSQALQTAHQLESGFVQINQYLVFKPSLPFGGFKHSGIGKEASLQAMIENYTKEKTLIINME